MPQSLSIRSPGVLHLTGAQGKSYGGNQAWYPRFVQRMSGCGPTNASHLAWYLAATRESCSTLSDPDGSRDGFLRQMQAMWKYVTPGLRGVDSLDMFMRGMAGYGESRGRQLRFRTREIPRAGTRQQETEARVLEFLLTAFADDLPVAFLNLDSGALSNLDNWHWVTLVGLDGADNRAVMYDQGRRSLIDLPLWMRTTRAGGGFVAAEPA